MRQCQDAAEEAQLSRLAGQISRLSGVANCLTDHLSLFGEVFSGEWLKNFYELVSGNTIAVTLAPDRPPIPNSRYVVAELDARARRAGTDHDHVREAQFARLTQQIMGVSGIAIDDIPQSLLDDATLGPWLKQLVALI